MEAVQLSLFPEKEQQILHKNPKQPRLGRYERLQRELAQNKEDPYKIFLNIKEQLQISSSYNFVDLFSGAGGMTQGLVVLPYLLC